jgi:hypothetical protein
MPDEIEPTAPTPEPSPQPDGGAYSRGEKISKINVAAHGSADDLVVGDLVLRLALITQKLHGSASPSFEQR